MACRKSSSRRSVPRAPSSQWSFCNRTVVEDMECFRHFIVYVVSSPVFNPGSDWDTRCLRIANPGGGFVKKGTALRWVPEAVQRCGCVASLWLPSRSPKLTFVIMPFRDEENSRPCSQVEPCPLAIVTGTAVGKSDALHAIISGLPNRPIPVPRISQLLNESFHPSRSLGYASEIHDWIRIPYRKGLFGTNSRDVSLPNFRRHICLR